MRINVEEIGDEGLEVQEPLSRAWLDQALASEGPAAFKAAAPAELAARLEKVDHGILLRARVAPKLTAPCRRCVKPVTLTLPVSFTLSLVPKHKLLERQDLEDDGVNPEAPGRGSFDPTDVEQEPFEGHAIELDPLVREQLLLALPMDALCGEGCKGLCVACGQDLNERACGCNTEAPDPRWESLRKLKLSN